MIAGTDYPAPIPSRVALPSPARDLDSIALAPGMAPDHPLLPTLRDLHFRWSNAYPGSWWHARAIAALARGWYCPISDRDQQHLYLLRCWLSVPSFASDGSWESANSVLLHYFLHPDSDPALHDHPWWFTTTILAGQYREHLPPDTWPGKALGFGPPWENLRIYRNPGETIHRRADELHCVGEIHDSRTETWTLVTTGPRERDRGFHPPGQRWLSADDYLAQRRREAQP